MSCLLGIDAGTTGIKSSLFSLDGELICSSIREYRLITPKPDYVELDPKTYWKACRESVRDVIKRSGISSDEVVALAISSQGETLIALDRDGRPLRNAIVWLDNRSREEAEILRKRFGEEEVYKITGQPQIVPTWPATKILWIKRNEPEIFGKVDKFLLVEDYLIYRLTGEYFTEYSVCSSTLYLDIRRDSWWDEMLDELGINADQLPSLKPSGTVVGEISAEASAELGLSRRTIVATGAFDQAASAIGAGNIKPGILSETTGAALAIVITVREPSYDPKRRIPCQRHAVNKLYFLMPWCQTAGMFLKWFRDTFCSPERFLEPLTGIDAYVLMDREAERVPPGSEGLVMLPHLMGAACPEFDPDAKAVMFGITLKHSKPHFIRAVMESVAYMLRRNLDVLGELGVDVEEVRSIGGAAKSRLWNRIKADVLQKRILIPKIKDTGALGAAILAGVASKAYRSIEDAVNSMVKIEDSIEPRAEYRELYDRLYEVYVKLYEYLKPLFKAKHLENI